MIIEHVASNALTQHSSIAYTIIHYIPRNDACARALSQVNDTTTRWKSLREFSDVKRTKLLEQLKYQQEIEELRISYANGAKDYNRWCKDCIGRMQSDSFGDSLEAVSAQESRLDREDNETNTENASKQKDLNAIGDKLNER